MTIVDDKLKKVLVEYLPVNAVLYNEDFEDDDSGPIHFIYANSGRSYAVLGCLFIDDEGKLAVQPFPVFFKFFVRFSDDSKEKEITFESNPELWKKMYDFMWQALMRYTEPISKDKDTRDVLNPYAKEVGNPPIFDMDPQENPEKWLIELHTVFHECSEYAAIPLPPWE